MPSVNEIWNGRTGGANDTGERTYRRVFRVVTEGSLITINAVRFTPGVPRLGMFYETPSGEFDLAARCRNIEIENTDEPVIYLVNCDYSNYARGIAGGGGDRAGTGLSGRTAGVGAGAGSAYEPNPIFRPAKFEFDAETYQEAIHEDIFGNSIVNNAGDLYDPPIERDAVRPVIVIHKNFSLFNADLAMAYNNATNSDTFLGVAPGKLKIQKITAVDAEDTWEDPISGGQFILTYVAATVTIHANKNGWRKRVANIGSRELIGGELKPIYRNGVQVTNWPLTALGAAADVGGTIGYNEWTVYDPLPFAALGLF